MADLGSATPRDPDALPPRNALEFVMNTLYLALVRLFRGNVLSAMKAGVLTS
jgi:hypothetical protein